MAFAGGAVGQVEEGAQCAPAEEASIGDQGKSQRFGGWNGQHRSAQHDDVEVLPDAQPAGGNGNGRDADNHRHDHRQLRHADIELEVAADEDELSHAESVEEHREEKDFEHQPGLAGRFFAGFQRALNMGELLEARQNPREQSPVAGGENQDQAR